MHADNNAASPIELRREIHAGIGTTCKSLHGIPHQIDQHLFDEIGIDGKFERPGVNCRMQRDIILIAFGLHEKDNAGKEFRDLKNLKIGARYVRELAIGFDKMEKSFAARLNRLQGGMYVGQGLGFKR